MTEQRHTADTITSDALDALYARIDRAARSEGRAKTRARVWLRASERYREAWFSARRGRRTLRARAEDAEAAIARVRPLLVAAPLPVGYDDSERAVRDFARHILTALTEPEEPTL